MEKRHRKLIGAFLACTMLGFVAVVATPGAAHTPPDNNVNFNPDEHNGDATAAGDDSKEAEILSDHQDGFGTTYELRAVADSQTAFYEWYDCDNGGNPTVAGPACQLAATDTSPDAAPAPAAEGTAASFSANYNIPAANDDEIRDIYGFACQSDAGSGPPAGTAHCIPGDVPAPAGTREGTCTFGSVGAGTCVANAHGDDAQTTTDHAATTNGRIQLLVTPSATFTDPAVHGAGLKNGDTLTVIAFTSAGGVDAVQVCMDQFSDDEQANDGTPGGDPNGDGGGCTHSGTDLTPTPGGGSGCHASAPTAAGGDCWAVSVGTPIQNTVFGVSLIEFDDFGAATGGGDAEGATAGTGDCAGATQAGAGTAGAGDDCQLDKIYVTTTPTGENPAVQPGPGPGPGPGPARCKKKTGNRGDNRLRGTKGCDNLLGRAGNDLLVGKAGNDKLQGGSGFDRCKGGPGRDKFRGCERKTQ